MMFFYLKLLGFSGCNRIGLGLISAPPVFEHLMHHCSGDFNFDECLGLRQHCKKQIKET